MIVWLALLACHPSADAVVKGLASDNPVAREDMARTARTVDDPSVVKALMASLSDPSDGVRLRAIDSLLALRATDAVPALCSLVANGSPAVRRAAVDALGRLGDARAAPVLIAELEAKPDVAPLDGIWALGQLGDPAAIPVLSRLRNSGDVYVAYNATKALRKIKRS
jgi:HEAT repeat protein